MSVDESNIMNDLIEDLEWIQNDIPGSNSVTVSSTPYSSGLVTVILMDN